MWATLAKVVGEAKMTGAKMTRAAQSKPRQCAEEGGRGMEFRRLTWIRACPGRVPEAVPEDEDAGAEGRMMVEAARGLMVVL
jgi:hypothetical protein